MKGTIWCYKLLQITKQAIYYVYKFINKNKKVQQSSTYKILYIKTYNIVYALLFKSPTLDNNNNILS